LRQANITQILISPYSLKEGVLFASSWWFISFFVRYFFL
jgi:hypothetical protein